MKKIFVLSIILFLAISCQSKKALKQDKVITQTFDLQKPVTKLAFGSCNKHDLDQPLWVDIKKQNPDVWVWLGDIIYADTENMREMQSYYNAQKERADYQSFLSGGCDVIGIWDDHDYGVNDGGKEYPYREESRDLLFEFLDVPNDHPSRKREGAYTSWTYGNGDNKVKVILLDARYFRDELKPNRSSKHRYKKNQEGDILGEEQWQWLDQELANSDAAVHIVCSGIQMISEEHYFEKWSNFPAARERLFEVFGKHNPRGLVLMSGDRHAGEVSKMNMRGLDYAVYEVTTSGMTHFWDFDEDKEPNVYRLAPRVGDFNYGLIEIEWGEGEENNRVTMELRGPNGKVYFIETTPFH